MLNLLVLRLINNVGIDNHSPRASSINSSGASSIFQRNRGDPRPSA